MDEFHAQVYHSILYPPLVMGIPNKAFLIMFISSLTMVGSLAQVWFLIPIGIIYIILRKITKDDIFSCDVYYRILKLPEAAD